MNDFKLMKSTNMLANQFLAGFNANNSTNGSEKPLPLNISDLTKNSQAFKNQGQCSFVDIGKVLLQASKAGDTIKVHECMKNGAPFTTDWLGTSPLHFAAKHNHVETCATLLRAGISKDAKTKVDRTPLHFAVYEGHYEVVKLLVSANCDIEQIDMLKMTPLHWAVEKSHYGIVELLLSKGANRNCVSKFGKTPYSMARERGDPQLLRLFDIHAQTSRDSVKQVQDATDSLMMEMEQQKRRNENDNNHHHHQQHHLHQRPSPLQQESKKDGHIKRPKLGSTSSNSDHSSLDEANTLAFKLLKDHGIQMLQNDDELDSQALIQSALEGGRKIVLSEAGKLMLNDTKLNKFLKVPFNTTITASPGSPTFSNPPLSPLTRNPPPSPLSRLPPNSPLSRNAPSSPFSKTAPPSSPITRNPPPSPLTRTAPDTLIISKTTPSSSRVPTPTRKSDTPDTPTFAVSLSDDEVQNSKHKFLMKGGNHFFKPYSLGDQIQDLTSNSRSGAGQSYQMPPKAHTNNTMLSAAVNSSNNNNKNKLYVPKNKFNLLQLQNKTSITSNNSTLSSTRHLSTSSSLSPNSEDSVIGEFVEPTTPRTPQHLTASDLEMLIERKFKELQQSHTELRQSLEREQQKSESYRGQLLLLQKEFELYKLQQQDKFNSLFKLIRGNDGDNFIEEEQGMDLTS